MINKIFDFIQKHNLIKPDSKLILGLSGGPDSVFLLHILKQFQQVTNFEILAAHLDHEWRANSSLDTEFCSKISRDLNIKFISAKASDLNLQIKFNGSKEEMGRKMRRFFFEHSAKEQNAHNIALAHHLLDLEETFFIRLIRGTTLSGLISIKPRDGLYIRPILELTKKEILDYLDTNNIPYLIDPTNTSPEFLRNRIRNTVIPALYECDNRFDANFLRTLNHLAQTEQYLEKLTQEKFQELSHKNPDNSYTINLEKLFLSDNFLQPKIILYWIIKSKASFNLTESFLNEILRFLSQPGSSTHQMHDKWKIEKKKNLATIIHI